MVIHWSWFRKEVVFYERGQSTRNLGQSGGKDVVRIWRKQAFAAVQETIETIFRIIVSANQLSLYGAVAEMCEEYETLHDRSGRLDVVMGQSIVLSAIRTEVSLESDG